MHYLDYNRTVIGYHGTRLSVALEIVQRKRSFDPSRNDHDWLGEGIYFWEHAPQQAARWAEQYRDRWGEEVAVLGSMIRLGNCHDLLDPRNVDDVMAIYERMKAFEGETGDPLPQNFNARKYLDCRVFNFAYDVLKSQTGEPIDTCRAVYVPTGKEKRAWPRSWITREAHIQLCVRNPACIIGTWLASVPTDPKR